MSTDTRRRHWPVPAIAVTLAALLVGYLSTLTSAARALQKAITAGANGGVAELTSGRYLSSLPEKSITGLTLSSVSISAKTGVTVRNAAITTSSTTIAPSSGSAWILQSNSKVS